MKEQVIYQKSLSYGQVDLVNGQKINVLIQAYGGTSCDDMLMC
jgi:hypothetical protein